MNTSRGIIGAALLVLLASALPLASGGGGSGRSSSRGYMGDFRTDDAECSFSISFDPIAYRLNSVAGKYKLLKVRTRCQGGSPIVLSRDDDRLVAQFGDTKVEAVLNPQRADPTFWDNLAQDLRGALAYPREFVAGTSGTESSFYALFPLDEARGIPNGFMFRIASVGAEAHLRQPRAAH